MPAKTIRLYCNKCSGQCRHDILHSEIIKWEEEIDIGEFIRGVDAYDLVKCCGCESVSMRHRNWLSEDSDDDNPINMTTVMYPPASFRREPKWLKDLLWSFSPEGDMIRNFMREIYIALRNKSLRLAVMGIRALLEQVMIQKVNDQGNFVKNLDAFESNGFVSHEQRLVLEPVIQAGHAAIHRGFEPTTLDVEHLMDITESIIESIFINQYRASALLKRVPSKPKKDKNN